jgi:hypothetical protein
LLPGRFAQLESTAENRALAISSAEFRHRHYECSANPSNTDTAAAENGERSAL